MKGKPEENKIREAFEEIRLPEGAKERMYQNILKKAEAAKLQEASQGKEAAYHTDQPPAQAKVQTMPQLQESAQSTGQEAMPAMQAAKMTPSKKSGRLSWRKYASLAACLVIFIAAGIFLPEALNGSSVSPSDEIASPPASEAPLRSESPDTDETPSANKTPDTATTPEDSDSAQKSQSPGTSRQPDTEGSSSLSGNDDDLMLSPSPFEDVTSAEDFSEALGFSIDAPEGAKDVSYSVAFGETAIVDFSLDGHSYTYYASKNIEDISADSDSKNTLCQTWESGGINYLLLNTDGASKTEFEKVMAALQNA